MIHYMKLRNDPFERIKSGKKKIEIRLYDEKRKLVKVSDEIEFTNLENNEKIKVRVKKIHRFDTFKDLFDYFDESYFGSTSHDYKKMYDYYSKEEENTYGVVGIEIEL